jgi:glycosyl transferase, family 25
VARHARLHLASSNPFHMFDQVRIINLVDRLDRRREMSKQLKRLGVSNASFFDARRPNSPADFPSVGARGCFESHLGVLKAAQDGKVETLLLIEDDLDFSRAGINRAQPILEKLRGEDWSFFYGAHILANKARRGLVNISANEPVMTASCVGFRGQVIPELVAFLSAMMLRPAGSPQYGPMHVDGAYTVFRELHPSLSTFVAFPSLGRQRSSPSDITPTRMLLDRWTGTQQVASVLRRTYNWLQRQS